jgi:uracil-DNA glycosylase
LSELAQALALARRCRLCADDLPLGPRPILQIGSRARLLIVSQAPGRRAHLSGVPFDDRSGDTLRGWLGLERADFYDPERVAILPVGLCYPGRGAGGDLPPRRVCAPLWHERLVALMPELSLILPIGRHAQEWVLGARRRASLTETVRAFTDYLPAQCPLPHPSPRNGPWLRRHPWFEREVLPVLQRQVQSCLGRPMIEGSVGPAEIRAQSPSV